MAEIEKLIIVQLAAHERIQKSSDHIDKEGLNLLGIPENSDIRDLFDKNKLKISISNTYQVESMLKSADVIFNLLKERKWYLLKTPPDKYNGFITSDNPLILIF